MSNTGTLDSETNNVTINGDTDESHKSREQEEVEHGFPMKVIQKLECMGLPKSYTHALYDEFVSDVKQIPAETASSLFSIYSWVRGGENKGAKDDITDNVTGEGDTINCMKTDSDPIANLKIVTPFGNVVKDEQSGQQVSETVVVDDQLSSENNVETLTHGSTLENGKELQTQQQPTTFDLPARNACSSESSIFDFTQYDLLDSASEWDDGTPHNRVTATPPDKEVKRVTFAPLSETNIYAYQQYSEGGEIEQEEPEPQFCIEVKKSISELANEVFNEKYIADVGADFTNSKDSGRNIDCDTSAIKSQDDNYATPMDNLEKAQETDCNGNYVNKNYIENYMDRVEKKDGNVSETVTLINTIDKSQDGKNEVNTSNFLHHLASQINKVEEVSQVACVTEIDKPMVKTVTSAPRTLSNTILAPTTSEVQLKLNDDLKTLEETVKNIYKNLNKKGPLTIVANFKPTGDGQLDMDMSSMAVKPNLKQKKSIENHNTMLTENNVHEESLMTPTLTQSEQSTVRQDRNNGLLDERTNVAQKRESIKQQLKTKPTTFPRSVSARTMKNKNTSSAPNQHSLPFTAPYSCMTQANKTPIITSKFSLKAVGKKETSKLVDRGSSALIPSLTHHGNKMSPLYPATSSHSVSKATPACIAAVHIPKQLGPSRSKQHKAKVSGSQHTLVKRYKILESSKFCQRFMVAPQLEQSYVSNNGGDTSVQKVSLEAPKSQYSHVSSQLSQQILMDHYPDSQNVTLEPPSSVIQNILLENPTPRTCKKSHYHSQTSTILPAVNRFRAHHNVTVTTLPPKKEHQHHPPQRKHGGDRCYKYKESEESASTISVASSVSTVSSGVEYDDCITSEGDIVKVDRSSSAAKQFRTIPSKPSKHNSYSAMFKDRQQRQTLYVDRTTSIENAQNS